MSPKAHDLGPLEMDVVGILESDAPCSVTTVQSKLKARGNDLAYTTVMTVLTRLYQKGFAQREKDGRQFVYSIGTSGKKAGENFLSRVKATFFQNQKLKPILTLIEDGDELSKDELMELKRVIQDKLAQGKKG